MTSEWIKSKDIDYAHFSDKAQNSKKALLKQGVQCSRDVAARRTPLFSGKGGCIIIKMLY